MYIHILILTSLPVGNWRPGEIPTKELLTLISSWIKTQKKGIIRKAENPQVLSLVLEEKQSYSEGEDCVRYKYFPRGWRCGQHYQFCVKSVKIGPEVWIEEWIYSIVSKPLSTKL